MCCAFATLVLLGPRVLNALLWLFWPQFNLAFKSEFLGPILGIIFLPWTTLMYVLIWTPAGVQPFGWFLLGLGFFADIASYLGGGYGNRKSVPGYDESGLEPGTAAVAGTAAATTYYSPSGSTPAAPAAPKPASPPPASKPPASPPSTPPASTPPAAKPPSTTPPPSTPTKPA